MYVAMTIQPEQSTEREKDKQEDTRAAAIA